MTVKLTVSKANITTSYYHHLRSGLALAFILQLVFLSSATAQVLNVKAPNFVPDRPGYADSTSSVDPGHWHLELGGSWLPSSDRTVSALVRYGLKYGWELRLMTPTLTQVLPYQDVEGNEINPELAVGGTLFGAKWAKHWSRLEFSLVTMVALPITGTSKALTPDPLVSFTSQISHALNERISAGLAFRYALHDGVLHGQEVAYGEELSSLVGLMGSLTWSDVGWSVYTQAGAEVFKDVLTPLVGTGITFRISQGSQVDLSLDAPLSSDGVAPRYMLGFTLSW